MVLGQKLFEEFGKISGFKVAKVHPLEGVATEISFTSDIKGVGRYPSGKNLASGTTTKYPHGIIDGSWQGTLTTELSEQFMWWSHEKGKVLEGGEIKGLNVTTGFTNSQKLSWMNNLIIVIELSGSIFLTNSVQLDMSGFVGLIIKKSSKQIHIIIHGSNSYYSL